MGIYGYGQARDARIFARSFPAMPNVTSYTWNTYPTYTLPSYNYHPSAWCTWFPLALFGLGAGAGIYNTIQSNRQYKHQAAQAQVDAVKAQELELLKNHRPGWKIDATPDGKYIATKLDASGNVVDEITGSYQEIMDQTRTSA